MIAISVTPQSDLVMVLGCGVGVVLWLWLGHALNIAHGSLHCLCVEHIHICGQV